MADVPSMLPAPGSRASELLGQIVDFLREQGTVNLSLRELARGAGTSHRMLQYYFTSRENLLGLVMLELSQQYIARFSGRMPTSRAETIQGVWDGFLDPGNRLQTQILFTLSAAAAERPDLEIPALTHDIDHFAAALTAFGIAEGLPEDRSRREARLIVSSLLGLYLDFFVTRGSDRVNESFATLKEWVERSSAGH